MTRLSFRFVIGCGVSLAALGLSGCKGDGATMGFKHNRQGGGTPVATWSGDSITQEELKLRLLEMSPFARARYQTVDQKKEYVEGLARFELMVAEAQRRGLQNDPEVVETAKKVMVQRLVAQEFDEKSSPVSDADVATYYEKHKADYVKPEMIRLSHLFLAAEKGSAEREAKRAKAEALRQKAAEAQPMDFQAFVALVRENTEDPKTKPLDGDTRYQSQEELVAAFGAEAAAAAGGLKEVGSLTPVVETDKGFHVFKLQGRQQALNLTLDQVKTQLQSRILYERRTERFNAFLEGLKKQAGFQVKADALSKVEVDMKAPSVRSSGPQPGFIPPPPPAQ